MKWTHGDLVKWTHGDLVKWTHDDLMKWTHGDRMKWTHGDLMKWTHGDLMKWTHGDRMKWTHGDLMKWCLPPPVKITHETLLTVFYIRPSNGQYDVHFINKVRKKQTNKTTTTTKQNINQPLNVGTIQGIELSCIEFRSLTRWKGLCGVSRQPAHSQAMETLKRADLHVRTCRHCMAPWTTAPSL